MTILKRAVGLVLLVVLVASGIGPASRSVRAQQDEKIVILASTSAQVPVEAWAAAFAAQQPEFDYTLDSFSSQDDLAAHIADADILITDQFDAAPPILFECGTISPVSMVLPGLGARYLASEDCGGYVAPKTPLLKAFLHFMVSPDGQQVAINLGLLPDRVEVIDQAGETVQVPQPVRRVIVAYGVATYYLYAVGASDTLVAAAYLSSQDSATAEAMARVDPNFERLSTAVSVLGQKDANIEEIAALNPDLLIVSARTKWTSTAVELGIPVVRFQGETPELFKEAMRITGAVLGPDAAYRAEQFNAYYDSIFDRIVAATAGVENRPRVYFSGTEPLKVASGDMYQTTMIAAAGGESVAKGLTGSWVEVNLEQVVVWNPQVIFVPSYGGASTSAITDSAEWGILDAVQNGQVYQMPQLLGPWDIPAPDSVLGVIWMAGKLYSGGLDIDCAAEMHYFYNTFYGYAVSADEVNALCQ